MTDLKAQLSVPIRSLGPSHRERIGAHLRALDRADRYLRFGYSATDEHIARYVASLDFDRDEIFGKSSASKTKRCRRSQRSATTT